MKLRYSELWWPEEYHRGVEGLALLSSVHGTDHGIDKLELLELLPFLLELEFVPCRKAMVACWMPPSWLLQRRSRRMRIAAFEAPRKVMRERSREREECECM